MKRKPGESGKETGTPAAQKTPWRLYLAKYWQFYAMAALPLAYFILFKWMPVLGNVLAFRRYRPLTGPYGVSWVGFRYFEQFLIYASLALTIISLIDYLVKNKDIITSA